MIAPKLTSVFWMNDDEEFTSQPVSITVSQNDEPNFTGLLNAFGAPLYRYPEPLGFKLRKD